MPVQDLTRLVSVSIRPETPLLGRVLSLIATGVVGTALVLARVSNQHRPRVLVRGVARLKSTRSGRLVKAACSAESVSWFDDS